MWNQSLIPAPDCVLQTGVDAYRSRQAAFSLKHTASFDDFEEHVVLYNLNIFLKIFEQKIQILAMGRHC